MDQSTVDDEIGLRVTICSEFLFDRNRPIEKAYESWIERVKGKLIEFAEFEYWFKRFQNNQFDLAYDTRLDVKQEVIEADEVPTASKQSKTTKKIADIPRKIKPQLKGVKNVPIVAIEKRKLDTGKIADISNEIAPKVRKTENVPAQIVKKKMHYQFNIQNVSQYLLAEKDIDHITAVSLTLNDNYSVVKFDNTQICIGEIGDWHLVDKWIYGSQKPMKAVKTAAPEESIIDHLWFVLKRPNLKLRSLYFGNLTLYKLLNFEKLNSMLRSMFNSLNHQIHVSDVSFFDFEVDTFGAILKNCEPGTLRTISFSTSNEKMLNYQKMQEIVIMDQWKQATNIKLDDASSLTFDDFLRCEKVTLFFNNDTPEDVVRVRDHCLNSPDSKLCDVWYGIDRVTFDEIETAFGSGHLERFRNDFSNEITYHYPIQDSKKILRVSVEQNHVYFEKIENNF